MPDSSMPFLGDLPTTADVTDVAMVQDTLAWLVAALNQTATPAASATDAWPQLQAILMAEIGEKTFATWLAEMRPVGGQWLLPAAANRLELTVPTLFIRDFIERTYLATLTQAASALAGGAVEVVFRVAPVMFGAAGPQPLQEVASASVPAAVRKEKEDGLALDARYTFETYVTGPSNQFAFAAARRVAEESAGVFNPFFVHGGVGLGKTHLMHALGWELKRLRPATRILYLSAEQFFMRFIRALREKDTYDFKEICRGADVLMVDDIQFIAGKEATQEEFFHTFNDLVAQGKKVILTADRSPHDLANIEARLQSRLGSGLTVEIHPPEVETRLAILQKKAEERELELAPAVLQFLAQSIQSNVRELEGALNRLLAFSRLTGTAITIDFAKEQLRDLLRVQIRVVGLEEIQQNVADLFGLRLADLSGPRRTKELALARQIAMWLAKQLTSKSYPDIGRAFGGRDHTTVMYAVDKIEQLKKTDPALAENLKVLERRLQGRG